ncbi:MAG: glycosyl hydrolase 115 family protein [Rhodothermales bacterium]
MDLGRVSGTGPAVVNDIASVASPVVVIGVLGQSRIIDALVASGKVHPGELDGHWEAFHIEVVDNPWPNVPRALVIVGSDRRGVVFGTYDISERIGVSPWYWWADVPVEHQSEVFVTAGSRDDRPYVRYRGFFINDEAPSMTTWVANHFDGWNADMYEHMFELLLRLKGNYLGPRCGRRATSTSTIRATRFSLTRWVSSWAPRTTSR